MNILLVHQQKNQVDSERKDSFNENIILRLDPIDPTSSLVLCLKSILGHSESDPSVRCFYTTSPNLCDPEQKMAIRDSNHILATANSNCQSNLNHKKSFKLSDHNCVF